MTVQNEYQQIQFSGGISPKTDPLQIQPPQVLQATNVEYSSVGAAKRRAGLVTLPNFTATNPTNLQATLDQLIVSDANGNLYIYSPGTNTWVNTANVSPNSVSVKKIGSTFQGSGYTGTGIRNLVWAHNGAGVGLLAYDNGYTYGSYNNLGTITLIAFDTTNGRPFWGRTTTGGYNTNGAYFPTTSASTTVAFSGSILGVGYPQIVYNASSGNFIVSFLATSAGTIKTGSTVQSSGNLYFPVVTAYSGYGVEFYPYSVSTGTSTGNPYVTWLSVSNTFVNAGGSNSDPQHYFDLQNNGSGNVALVQYAASYGTSGSLSGNVMTYVNTISPAATSNNKLSYVANSGPTTASPVAIAFDQYNPSATYAVYTTGYGANTFTSSTMSTTPTVSALTAHIATYGAYVYPITVGLYNGTSTITNGYVWETYSTGTGFLSSGTLQTYMMPTAAKPAPVVTNTNLYPGPVASQIFYLKRVDNAGYDACCWLYALSSNGTPGVAAPGGGAFGAAYVARIGGSSTQPAATALYMRTQIEVGLNARACSVNLLNGGLANLMLTSANIADQVTEIEIFNLMPNPNPEIIPLPQGALFTGSNTSYFDGQSIRTAGWPKIPELDTAPTTATTGGGLVSSTPYTYFFVFADYDINGNVLYSSPSPPYTVTTGSSTQTNAVTFLLGRMVPSSFNSYLATIYVYRNCSAAVDPLNYYRCGTIPMSSITGPSYTWTDTTIDNIVGNILLYSPPGGGELPNDMAPASSCAISTKSRCYVGSSENGSWLFYSKPFYYGRMPCEFNAAQFIDIDPSTGPINGLGALDENIIIFKPNNIYLLTGSGPDATGVGAFNPAAQLASDTGLQDPESLITTEDGIYFRSARGIEILTRAYAVQYIGEPVEPYLYGTTCLNSIIVPTHNQVRFFLSSGVVLCYDYTLQVWTNYAYNAFAGTSTLVADATLYNGCAYMLLTGTSVFEVVYEPTLAVASQSGTSNFDPNGYVPVTLQTAHINVAGPEGWGRVRRCNILGKCLTASSLAVTFIYDYGLNSSTTTVAISTAGPFNIRVRAPQQQCSVVSIQIVDTPSTGTGQGCVISKIVLETAPKSGALRVPDAQSF